MPAQKQNCNKAFEQGLFMFCQNERRIREIENVKTFTPDPSSAHRFFSSPSIVGGLIAWSKCEVGNVVRMSHQDENKTIKPK